MGRTRLSATLKWRRAEPHANLKWTTAHDHSKQNGFAGRSYGNPAPKSHKLTSNLLIGLTAFLTVVDLIATQAILPTLTRHYQLTPVQMGLAVNAGTIGMAVTGLAVALFSKALDRRLGVLGSLVLPWRLRFI